MHRRTFLEIAALGTGAAAVGCAPGQSDVASAQTKSGAANPAFAGAKPMTAGIVPISDDERSARIAKAQRLMAEQKIDAIFMEGTVSSFYFVNMRWGQSERTFGVVIPAKGEIAYVCPKFEEDRALELIKFGKDVRTWEEDESRTSSSPDREGSRRAAPPHRDGRARPVLHRRRGPKEAAGIEIVDATPMTGGCRIYKSAAEIALMQRAMDVTIEAYKMALATLRDGMPQNELGANIAARFARWASTGARASSSANGPRCLTAASRRSGSRKATS